MMLWGGDNASGHHEEDHRNVGGPEITILTDLGGSDSSMTEIKALQYFSRDLKTGTLEIGVSPRKQLFQTSRRFSRYQLLIR